ncbi:MAG TPA: L,D-transpeptidase family protein [Prosthecobacter sp.]|nr:L,D-transpeptidase family protein [Prosthecobacter sp.]
MKGKLLALILLAVGLSWLNLRGARSSSNTTTCLACVPGLSLLSPAPPPATLSFSPHVSSSPAPLSPSLVPPLPLTPLLPPMPPEPPAFPPPLPLPYAAPPAYADWQKKTPDERLGDVRSRLLPRLHEELAARQLRPGSRAFLRAFKESRELELWLRNDRGGDWILYRTYPVQALSGTLGPKIREGDGQTPEGIYTFGTGALNPASLFHLSFNIGYPNSHDRHHNRTGSAIMVHGSNVSIGCLAMSDPAIEEIYWLVTEALNAGQSVVPIHIFPFRMTEDRMAAAAGSPHLAFWQDLKPIHDHFESTREVPAVNVADGRYRLSQE